MIRLFTRKLPKDISRDIFFEFRRKNDALWRLLEKSNRYPLLKKDQELTELILACSIFNYRVLMQISEASRISERLRSKNIETICFGSFDLGSLEAADFKAITKEFKRILYDFEIPILDPSDIVEFAKYANNSLRSRNE